MMQNTLYTGDNLYILNGTNSKSVDLIYLDPPFNSKRTYSAPIGSKAAGASFKDMWTWQDVDWVCLETLAKEHPVLVKFIESIGKLHSKAMMSYIMYMAQRIIEMHRVLKDTGSLYLHADPTASHYLKIMLDGIFDKSNFRNEIIWHYRRWTAGNKNFQKMHDTIYRYSKGKDFTFNLQFEPYGDWINKDYKYIDPDSGKRWRWHTVKGKRYKVFLEDRDRGVKLNDVWHINYLGSTSKERTGYPTQKPLALLHRIIEASSNQGDVVLDPFCGYATTCVAAQQSNRKWIGVDIEKQAANLLMDRLSDDAGLFKDFVHRIDIPKRTDVKEEPPSIPIKEKLHEEQSGQCNGCREYYKIKDLEIDHIVPRVKGGGDYYENYQLLCSHCNRSKGSKPMEHWIMTRQKREEMMKSLTFGQ